MKLTKKEKRHARYARRFDKELTSIRAAKSCVEESGGAYRWTRRQLQERAEEICKYETITHDNVEAVVKENASMFMKPVTIKRLTELVKVIAFWEETHPPLNDWGAYEFRRGMK